PGSAVSAALMLLTTVLALSPVLMVTDTGLPLFNPAAVMVIAPGVSAPVKPPVPLMPIGELISPSTCVGVMPGTMATSWPLMVKLPPFTSVPGRICVPVTDAIASGDRVAPKPVILAGAGEPAIGLAENVFGSISSEPGTLTSCAVVSG